MYDRPLNELTFSDMKRAVYLHLDENRYYVRVAGFSSFLRLDEYINGGVIRYIPIRKLRYIGRYSDEEMASGEISY